MSKNICVVAVVTIASFFALAATAAAAGEEYHVERFAPEGAKSFKITDGNDSGHFCGNAGKRAFAFIDGQFIEIETPYEEPRRSIYRQSAPSREFESPTLTAIAISDSNDVLVRDERFTNQTRSFIWRHDADPVILHNVHAKGMSVNGRYVIGHINFPSGRTFVWQRGERKEKGTFTLLDKGVTLLGVANNGDAVGYTREEGEKEERAVLCRGKGEEITLIPHMRTASAISADGRTVGGITVRGGHACYRTADGTALLVSSDGLSSAVNEISPAGKRIVGTVSLHGGQKEFLLWQPGESEVSLSTFFSGGGKYTVSLDGTEYWLYKPVAVTESGRIFCNLKNPSTREMVGCVLTPSQ